MYIAIPVYPPVVIYVNETNSLFLSCSNVITASALVVTDVQWLDPNGNVVSLFANHYVTSVNHTNAGTYTCITSLVSNVGGLTMVNASTQVVVYCMSIMPKG